MTVDYANKEQIAKFLEGGIDFMYRHLGGSPPLREFPEISPPR